MPGTFTYYDPKEGIGRPRRNDSKAKILESNGYLYIGKNVVKDCGLSDASPVRLARGDDGSILIVPSTKGVGTHHIRYDVQSDRYRLYVLGFMKRFNMPESFFDRRGLKISYGATGNKREQRIIILRTYEEEKSDATR